MAKSINEGLTFDVILEKTKQYVNGDITLEEYQNWSNSIAVRPSLGMLDKLEISLGITTMLLNNPNSTAEILVCELYKNLFFYGYLGGYLGIKIDTSVVTYENYDLLEPLFGPWIESYASRDINLLKDIVKDSINFYNNATMLETLSGIDYDQIQKQTESVNKFIRTLNDDAELIKDLAHIQDMNNPLTKQIVEIIRDQEAQEKTE